MVILFLLTLTIFPVWGVQILIRNRNKTFVCLFMKINPDFTPEGNKVLVGLICIWNDFWYFPVPPRLAEMFNRTQEEGGRETLTCRVNAQPPPQMWFKKPDNYFCFFQYRHVLLRCSTEPKRRVGGKPWRVESTLNPRPRCGSKSQTMTSNTLWEVM